MLLDLFLHHPGVAPVAAALDAIEQGLPRLCSIFISSDGNHALAYENTVLQDLSGGIGSPYDCYWFRRDAHGEFRNELLPNFHSIPHACSIPLVLYDIAPPSRAGIALIGFILDRTPYKSRFIGALGCQSLPPDVTGDYKQRISLADDIQLMEHFTNFYQGERGQSDFQVSAEHVDRLWGMLSSAIDPLTDCATNRARMLLCVGALFVRYSSAAIFGTEHDSLSSVRDYAWACLNRAHTLDASLLGASTQDIGRSLLGAPGVRGIGLCTNELTAVLSNTIQERLPGDPALATCFKAIYPQAWIRL